MIPTRQSAGTDFDTPVIPTSPQHTPTYGRTSDYDTHSVGSGRSTGGGINATSHYSSPTAAAVKDRYRSERETRSLSAAKAFEQFPMTRANRKRSEEDPHIAKRLKR